MKKSVIFATAVVALLLIIYIIYNISRFREELPKPIIGPVYGYTKGYLTKEDGSYIFHMTMPNGTNPIAICEEFENIDQYVGKLILIKFENIVVNNTQCIKILSIELIN